MKGKTAVFLSAVLGLQLALSAFPVEWTFAADVAKAPGLLVNGASVALQKKTWLHEGRTYISGQDAARVLGGEWKREGKRGILKLREDRILVFQTDAGTVEINGVLAEQAEPALIHQQEVYLPLRWIAEQAGHEVVWNAAEKRVEIAVTQKEGGLTVLEPDQLSAEELEFVQSVRNTPGIHRKGNLVVIARGEVPHPGYGVTIAGTEWAGKQLIVNVKWTDPEPGKMYIQVLSYPYVAFRLDLPPNTAVQFRNADTGVTLFPNSQANF